MKSLSRVMEFVPAYRLWQAPFAERKLAPLRRHNDLSSARRVLDLGCGPGTNARHFTHADYVGVDNNPEYITWARRHCPGRFVVADVSVDIAHVGSEFDFILANSFFHHVATRETRQILARVATLLSKGGHVHVLDLVMPRGVGLPRLLAGWDRGEFPRPLEEWRVLFAESFEPILFEPYPLGIAGMTLWQMVYFKGRRSE